MIEGIQAAYCFAPRLEKHGPTGKDPVIDLVERYDASTVDIGSLTFRASPQRHRLADGRDVLIVGDFDADAIALDEHSNHILLLDGCDLSFAMTTLAMDGGRFLEALIFLVEKKHRSTHLWQIARQCAELAGAPEAAAFYQMFLG
jgi:hypothetical protein